MCSMSIGRNIGLISLAKEVGISWSPLIRWIAVEFSASAALPPELESSLPSGGRPASGYKPDLDASRFYAPPTRCMRGVSTLSAGGLELGQLRCNCPLHKSSKPSAAVTRIAVPTLSIPRSINGREDFSLRKLRRKSVSRAQAPVLP